MFSDEKGFTLVEVLVATTLLVMGVLATLMLIDSANRTTAVSKQRDMANAVAQELIERAAGGRYNQSRNDLTDVDPASTTPGPADRLKAGMDPDGDQSSTAVSPATKTTGSLPLDVPQSWSLRRKNTTFTVSYRACTSSDTYRQIQIAGPFDCDRATTTPPSGGDQTTTPEGCSLGVVSAAAVDPANPGVLTAKLQVMGIVGVSACVGAVSPPLSTALCTLLGSSQTLSDALVGASGALTTMLGGVAGVSIGACSPAQIEQVSAGAIDGMASSTRVAVTVGWTDFAGKAHSITRSSLIRRAVV